MNGRNSDAFNANGRIVIVGASLAGLRGAEALRKSRGVRSLPGDMRVVPAKFPPRGVPTSAPDVLVTGHDPSERQAEFRPRARAHAAETTRT
jgi:hypothetical protein